MSPVKAPPAPEEDFFILEDEAPLLFRIPRTMSSSRRHSTTSGAVLDGQTSQMSPGKPSETVEKEQDVADATKTLQRPVIYEAKKPTKEKVKKSRIPEPPESQPEKLRPPVDGAAIDRLVHEKPIKKQRRVRQVHYEKGDADDVKPQDTAGEATTDFEEPSRKMTKKSQKNTEVKKPRAVKQKKTEVKKGRKEMPHVDDGMGDDQRRSDDGHPASPSGDVQNPDLHLA